MTDWQEYLHGRGIDDVTIRRYQLQGGFTYDERPAIKYPVFPKGGGELGYRFKFTDGNKPKVKSQVGLTMDTYPYYSAGGLGDALKASAGLMYLLSGEPDVWTMHTVTQRGENAAPATCFIGEGSIPPTFVEDMKGLGVRKIAMWPDLDQRGMKTAYKVFELLKGSDIGFDARLLPGEQGSKRDLNQVWQDSKFEREAFWDVLLVESRRLTDDDLYLYAETKEDAPKNKQQKMDLSAVSDAFKEWIDSLIVALGPYHMKEGRVERWHCPLPGHVDKDPSFTIKAGDIIPMPVCTCGIQERGTPTQVWNEVARALNQPTWDEYKVEHLKLGTNAANGSAPAARPTVAPADIDQYFTDSHAAYKELLNHLMKENLPDAQFLEFPLTILHQFGGFAETMWMGKLVYIVGISGGGKTSLAETMGGKWLREGMDFVWFGPEWTPYEMAMRELQRQGGMTAIRITQALQWEMEAARGIPELGPTGKPLRKGKPFPEESRQESMRIMGSIANWPGRAYYLNPEANRLQLPELLDVAEAIINQKRAAGRKVVAFFFDYLQRANMGGRGNNAFWSEEVADRIKAFCERMGVVGIVMIQPRKDDSADTREGELLDASSGQGISDQKCNLYLAVTPVFVDGERQDAATVRIVKNSMGRLGEIPLPTDFSKLLWIDAEAVVKQVDLRTILDAPADEDEEEEERV